jgi:hypothetical protein
VGNVQTKYLEIRSSSFIGFSFSRFATFTLNSSAFKKYPNLIIIKLKFSKYNSISSSTYIVKLDEFNYLIKLVEVVK